MQAALNGVTRTLNLKELKNTKFKVPCFASRTFLNRGGNSQQCNHHIYQVKSLFLFVFLQGISIKVKITIQVFVKSILQRE